MNKIELVQLDTTTIQLIDGDRGINYPNKKDFLNEGYCLFLDSSNLTKNGFNFTSKAFINEKKDQEMGKGRLQRGDLVVNTRGTIGNIGLYTEDIPFEAVRINSGMLIIRGGADYDNKFLYFFLRSKLFFSQVEHLMSGSVQNQLPIWVMQYIKLPKIDINYQHKISNVLSAIDSKIELNNETNAELEVMAKTIFDYWFVQFDFPDENGKPYKSSGGKMIWNEEMKRKLPELWEVNKINKYGDFKNGINYDPSLEGDTDAKIINVRNISSGTLFVSQYELDTITLKKENVDNYLVTGNDILIARSGIPGATRLMFEYAENTIYCGFIIRFQVNTLANKYYLFYFLKGMEKNTTSKSGGTILSNVNQDTLKRMDVVMPDNELLIKFNEVVSSIFKIVNNNNKENKYLSELRDWLLPMLMNDQVQVADFTKEPTKVVVN